MNTAYAVLKKLEEHRGDYFSGQPLADELGISRAAVWKAISLLREEGHTIEASTSKGYRLSPDSGLLSVAGISPYLSETASNCDIRFFKVVDSTNNTAKELMLSGGAGPGAIILAEEQSRGKGRLGRSFYSPPSGSIYVSFILKAPSDFGEARLATVAAAVAVCHAVEAFAHVSCEIKWINDVFTGGKKICGILTEAVSDVEAGGIESLILGIGVNININDSDFPDNLAGKAGAVSMSPGNRCRFAAELINQVIDVCGRLNSRSYMEEYRNRSMVIGKDVFVIRGGNTREAMAIDIDDEGRLIVEYSGSASEALSSGEISIRLKK